MRMLLLLRSAIIEAFGEDEVIRGGGRPVMSGCQNNINHESKYDQYHLVCFYLPSLQIKVILEDLHMLRLRFPIPPQTRFFRLL